MMQTTLVVILLSITLGCIFAACYNHPARRFEVIGQYGRMLGLTVFKTCIAEPWVMKGADGSAYAQARFTCYRDRLLY